jgi:hypothetical protein
MGFKDLKGPHHEKSTAHSADTLRRKKLYVLQDSNA